MELQKVIYIPNHDYSVGFDGNACSCVVWGATITQLNKGRK